MASTSWNNLPRYISVHQVTNMLGVHRNTLDKWLKKGTFVQPVRLGSRFKKFDRFEVMLLVSGMTVDEVAGLTEDELTEAVKERYGSN